MSALSDFHTVQIIIRHCTKAEGVADEEFALRVADQKGFILHRKTTRTGRIVAALVDADQDVTEFNICQISEHWIVTVNRPTVRPDSSVIAQHFL